MISRKASLFVPAAIYARLRQHLYPGDNLEAAALLLCTITNGRRKKLIARDVILVPYDECDRQCDALTWPGHYVEAAIDAAESEGLAVIAMHSHPGGLFAFSATDDASDLMLMQALLHGAGLECGSAIMTPDGAIRARLYGPAMASEPVDLICVPGHDIHFVLESQADMPAASRRPMAFTSGMRDVLGCLSACVIGVSGTGSIVAEQLARLGFGEIILVDFDRIEARNLNRILNSRISDIGRLKVDVFADAIRGYRPECDVRPVPENIGTREAILAASEADVLFSCVDSSEGRHIADRIAAAMVLPLFDVGVSIPTRADAGGARHIAEACGRVDYVFPGGSNLGDREVYTPATLEGEYLRRTAPDTHRRKVEDGYLRGVVEEAPAVIALNMRAASALAMEFIARTFSFRHDPNERYARSTFLLAEGEEERTPESAFVSRDLGIGSVGLREPLLNLPALMRLETAA